MSPANQTLLPRALAGVVSGAVVASAASAGADEDAGEAGATDETAQDAQSVAPRSKGVRDEKCWHGVQATRSAARMPAAFSPACCAPERGRVSDRMRASHQSRMCMCEAGMPSEAR